MHTLMLAWNAFTVLLGLWDFLSDVNLILKIFVLLTIISFVNNHIENPNLKLIVMALFAYFLLFDLWRLFLPIYGLYILLMFGFGGILVDLFFTGAFQRQPAPGMEEEEGAHSMELKERQHMLHQAQQRFIRHPPRGR
ncbi:MAG: hypothetical protein HY393_01265 [Candidatus Diapherotrites archaeon]|nr:hypothetical protein [Candidatus Diapherotrites archaeon]